MPLRFSDPNSRPSGTVVFDGTLRRWRWGFRGSRDSLRAEVAVALAHIESNPPDQTVFGVIYDPTAGKRSAADMSKATASRKNAEITAKTALGAVDFMREGMMMGAVEIIQDVRREYNPNDLWAADAVIRFLHLAKAEQAAIAEWADLYCRVASAASTFRRSKPGDPTLQRVREAYEEFFTSVLPLGLEGNAQLLEIRGAYDAVPIVDLPMRNTVIDETATYLEIYGANWLSMVCQSADSMRYFQLAPATFQHVQDSIETMMRAWKASNLPVYTPRMRQVFLKCIGALGLALERPVPVRPTEIRVAACRALGAIPIPECQAYLQKHLQYPDPIVRKEVEEAARRQIEVGFFGLA
jgi:hypothetical protein